MEHKRAWLYCRTAYPDAYALAIQQAQLEGFAEKQDFEIVGVTVEHASGLNFSRRGLAEVSSAVEAGGIDFLLVTNLSRLGRDLQKTDAYLRWLEDHFVDVVCADGTIPQTCVEILLALIKEHSSPMAATH